jgi:hypothetical protein
MLLTLMGNNWMFQTERSGWWRLWLAEATQKALDERNAKRAAEVKKPEEILLVESVSKKKPKKLTKKSRKLPQKRVKIAPYLPPVVELPPTEPSMYEKIGSMPSYTLYSFDVFTSVIEHQKNVVDLESRRRKKRQQEEEEFLILLAA